MTSSALSLGTLPHSPEAERTVIGALLLDPDSFIKVADRLQPSDFYDPIYGSIYEAICETHSAGSVIDFVTVTEKLQSNKKLQAVGGSAFIAQLTSEVPTASHVERYASIVREKCRRRQMIAVGHALVGLGREEDTPLPDLMETAEQKLLALTATSTDQKPLAIGSLNDERFNHYCTLLDAEDPSEHFGVRTGFADLDSCILGLQQADVMVLAGQTSTGKTAVALEFARRIAIDQGKSVAIFSLEMTSEQLYDRLYAAVLGVDEARLSQGDLDEKERKRMGTAADTLACFSTMMPTGRLLTSRARRDDRRLSTDLTCSSSTTFN